LFIGIVADRNVSAIVFLTIVFPPVRHFSSSIFILIANLPYLQVPAITSFQLNGGIHEDCIGDRVFVRFADYAEKPTSCLPAPILQAT
jgi:hypothetical protein